MRQQSSNSTDGTPACPTARRGVRRQFNANLVLALAMACVGVPGNAASPIYLPEIEGAQISGLRDLAVSADGTHAVFLGARNGQVRLFSRDFDEPFAVDISPAGFEILWGPRIAPDSQRVLVFAQQVLGGPNQLWSIPIDGPGSAAVRLDEHPPVGFGLYGFEIAPSSTHVVYLSSELTPTTIELFSVPIAGSPTGPTRISQPLSDGQHVFTVGFSPDDNRVAYSIQDSNSATSTIWSTSLLASEPQRVSPDGLQVNPSTRFGFSATGDRVAYMTYETAGAAVTASMFPIDGNTSTCLSCLDEAYSWTRDFLASPGTDWILFAHNPEPAFVFQLFAVEIGGAADDARFIGDLLDEVAGRDFKVSSDGAFVIFIDASPTPDRRLWSARVDGTSATYSLLPNWGIDLAISGFEVVPSMNEAVYSVRQWPSRFGWCFRTSLDEPDSDPVPLWTTAIDLVESDLACLPSVPNDAVVLVEREGPDGTLRGPGKRRRSAGTPPRSYRNAALGDIAGERGDGRHRR